MGTRVRVGLVGQATGFGLIRVDLSADEMAGAARPGHRVSDFCPRWGVRAVWVLEIACSSRPP